MAGTALTMASKAIIKGTGAYGWEEVGTDAGIGLVDALLSVLTAGTAGKILKGSPFLLKMAERKALGKLVANFIAHAGEGALQSAPGALLGSAANKQNYKEGNAILNILEGAAVQVGGAAVLSGGIGAFHGTIKDNMLIKARTDPEFQERVFQRYVAENAKINQPKTDPPGMLPPWPLTNRMRANPTPAKLSRMSATMRWYVSRRRLMVPG